MAFANGNLTANMTEVNDSIAPMMTTVLGGQTGTPYDELRARRQAITAFRKQLLTEYNELAKMDQDGIDNFACDFDEKRRRLWQMTVDYVSLAREKHDQKLISPEELGAIASSLIPMGKAWSKTRYFYTEHGYGNNPYPTRDDVFKAPPRTGSKRAANDFSINTDINVQSPIPQCFRSSSPFHEGIDVEEINVSEVRPDGGAAAAVPPPAPTTPAASGPLAAPPVIDLAAASTPPLSVSNVGRWTEQAGGDAATPSPANLHPGVPLHPQRMRRVEADRLRKENEELKAKLTAAAAEAKKACEEAVKVREKQLVDEANARHEEAVKAREQQLVNEANARHAEAVKAREKQLVDEAKARFASDPRVNTPGATTTAPNAS